MSIDLDVQWPYVFTRFDGVQTVAELDAHIARMQKWMAETDKLNRDHCVAVGMINSSTGFRFLLSTLFLFRPMPCPYDVHGTYAEALAFVKKHANQRSLALGDVKCPWRDVP